MPDMQKAMFLLPLCAVMVVAQENPLSSGIKMVYGIAKGNVTKAAEKMPEENYSFKPTPDVRSFGQLIGHVANANYMFCSAAIGEKSPSKADIEKTATSKADLVKALNESFAYCDKVYDGMTDANAADKIKFFGRDATKLGTLSFNNAHDMEHYGNMVTYMRLKNIVPPSSERQGPPPSK